MSQELMAALTRMGVPDTPGAIAKGHHWQEGQGEKLSKTSPIDGSELLNFYSATAADISTAASDAEQAFLKWRMVPAPQRGEFVRQLGQALRAYKSDLATVVSYEAGKITQEALGEVQEMIDICDFAVGLSRQLYGLTIASERPQHRLMEQWHPLGPVGVITAFNFPVAVWAWNAMLAFVCGDPVIWKPSEKTPLCALACQGIVNQVLKEMPEVPMNLNQIIIGGAGVGEALADNPKIPLISATGSVPMGRAVAQHVAARLGKSLLELGGNNAMVVTPSADLELVIRSAVFSAVGTCGQRCTSLRRLIVHESRVEEIRDRLLDIYKTLPIGNPLEEGTLVGPLIDERAFTAMQSALEEATAQGGTVHLGNRVTDGLPENGFYVQPALVEINDDADILLEETFAPILYLIPYSTFDEAIAIQNGVSQGLAAAVMTNDVREAELFCSPRGADCGIVNVNIGTSGAEIGGAFGGEKDTGGGRESGSDSWKNYMRRATNTINYSTELPLAQGIRFEISDSDGD